MYRSVHQFLQDWTRQTVHSSTIEINMLDSPECEEQC